MTQTAATSTATDTTAIDGPDVGQDAAPDVPVHVDTSRPAPFAERHIGPSPDDVTAMLEVVGQPSLDALVDVAVPGAIRSHRALRLDAAPSESAVVRELRGLASLNTVMRSMIGLGYYGTVTPPVVQRNVLENPAWYTAYTPYQPEISQGRLEALINFQTVVSDLTGLPVAGASLLDESTAVAEAMTLMRRSAKSPAEAVLLVDRHTLPQSIAVTQTRGLPLGIEVAVADLAHVDSVDALRAAAGGRDVFGVVVQYPGADGELRDFRALTAAAHEHGALVTAAADLLALTLVTPPGEWGADIAVGSSQRFGVPMGFGGPHAGYMSVRTGLERQMPGRLVGVSVDAAGHPAYRLALQTREQHIRREKATSNICTAQVLLAVMASMYAVWHGPAGLAAIARRSHGYARALADGLRDGGVDVLTDAFFDTVTVRVPEQADDVLREAVARGVNLRRIDDDTLSMSTDETTTGEDLLAVWGAFGVAGGEPAPSEADPAWWDGAVRTSDYLTHPVFSTHHSETAMLRYLRRLADRDFALDRGMIPLGSCTMKLNATTEMLAVTWPEFANLHPFAPTSQTEGIRSLVADLSAWLCEITGYDAVSLQPNAGSQGELAGLLAIHAYHQANGESHRRVCLIPASAHGTNAASAVMAGLRVVVVGHRRGERERRHGRPAGQGRAARRQPRGGHGDVPLDARRLRGHHRRALRAGPRGRRPGLRRRRQPQRAHGAGPARQVRRRRLPPEPAQDLLHPARRRRSRRRSGGRARAPGAVPAEPPARAGGRAGHGRGPDLGGALRVRRHPADLLGLRAADGRRRPDPGHRGGRPQRELHRGPAA